MLVTLILAAQLVIPTHDGLVNDTAHVLTPQTVHTLEIQLREFEQQTTIEFAVLTVPDLQGETVEQFAEQVFQAWHIGKKDTNNGLLFVLAVKDRKMRFEVGYGLESSFPDGRAGQILRSDQVRPYLQRNDWNAGISGAVTSAIVFLRNPVVPQPAVTATVGVGIYFIVLVAVAFLVVVTVVILVLRKKDDDEHFVTDDDPPYTRTYRVYGKGTRRNTTDDPTPSAGWISSPGGDISSIPSSDSGGFDFGGGSSGGGGASGDF